MLYNYHTHTKRCNHAVGTEHEYVESAIACGMKILGISDHAPYLFEDTDYYSYFRMQVDELHDYVETVRSLQKEYEKDINIVFIGSACILMCQTDGRAGVCEDCRNVGCSGR